MSDHLPLNPTFKLIEVKKSLQYLDHIVFSVSLQLNHQTNLYEYNAFLCRDSMGLYPEDPDAGFI